MKRFKKSPLGIFRDGMRKVLHSLKKKKIISSFQAHEGYYDIFFNENHKVRLRIIQSHVYMGDIIPQSQMEKAGYSFNYDEFTIGFGSGFNSSSIKGLERLLKDEARARKKGMEHEHLFEKEIAKLISLGEIGLTKCNKTSVIEEQNGHGDYRLLFECGHSFAVDVKSSYAGVLDFFEKTHQLDNIFPINYGGMLKSQVSVKSCLTYLYSFYARHKNLKEGVINFHKMKQIMS